MAFVISLGGPAQAVPKEVYSFGAPTRTVIDNGQPGASVGDMTITTGDVMDADTGRQVGYYTTNQVTVRSDSATGREIRRVELSVSLRDGVLFATGLIRAKVGTPPTQRQEFALIGGTRAHAGAWGTLIHEGIEGTTEFRVTIDEHRPVRR